MLVNLDESLRLLLTSCSVLVALERFRRIRSTFVVIASLMEPYKFHVVANF